MKNLPIPVWMAGLVLLFPDSTFAQSEVSEQLLAPLRDIPRAIGQCLQSEGGQHGSGVLVRHSDPDRACGKTYAELAKRWGSAEMILADLRLPQERAQYPIEGAYALSSAELKTKRFWQDKTVVLLGSGKLEQELYATCAALRGQGFRNAVVLSGGVPRLYAAGIGVLRADERLTSLIRLTALEMWAESRSDSSLVLLSPSREDMRPLLAGAPVLQELSLTTVKQALAVYRRATRGRAPLKLVLVADINLAETELERLHRGLGDLPLWVYLDDKAHYLDQIAQQQAVWASRERGPRQLGCGL